MIRSRGQKAWMRIAESFPERQVYIRSASRVQFFTVSPLAQALCAGIGLLFVGWVTFTSATTLFKDQIASARESHFRQLQLAYEARLARAQISTDQVRAQLRAAERRFTATAQDLEQKHRALAQMIRHKEALRASLGLGELRTAQAEPRLDPGPRVRGGIGGSADEIPIRPAAPSDSLYRPAGSIVSDPAPAEGAPANGGPAAASQASSLLGGALTSFAEIFRNAASRAALDDAPLRRIASAEQRLSALYPTQERLLTAAATDAELDEQRFVRAIRLAGLDPASFIARVEAGRSDAGAAREPVSTAAGFDARAGEAAARMRKLDTVVTALRTIPLSSPVSGTSFEKASGFGVRRDPFTGRQAFHAGIDFSGPLGAPVRVTSAGVVTFASTRGAYGNTVEVDHGFGIRTRYGHLSKILVKVGDHLEKSVIVGKLGSTGRSTGPHVHYEIWYNDAVTNPSKFLKAGSYVHEE